MSKLLCSLLEGVASQSLWWQLSEKAHLVPVPSHDQLGLRCNRQACGRLEPHLHCKS